MGISADLEAVLAALEAEAEHLEGEAKTKAEQVIAELAAIIGKL